MCPHSCLSLGKFKKHLFKLRSSESSFWTLCVWIIWAPNCPKVPRTTGAVQTSLNLSGTLNSSSQSLSTVLTLRISAFKHGSNSHKGHVDQHDRPDRAIVGRPCSAALPSLWCSPPCSGDFIEAAHFWNGIRIREFSSIHLAPLLLTSYSVSNMRQQPAQ